MLAILKRCLHFLRVVCLPFFFLLLLLISLPKDVIDAEEENGHASGFRLEKEKRVQSGIEYYATEAKVGES